MFGKVKTACVLGIDGYLIDVEVDIANGLPQVTVVGLPDAAVRESIERVRAAVKNCGYAFPMERVTVNLAPADVRKEGASYDLAIALCLLATSSQLQTKVLENCLVIGELALDGSLRPVPGVLAMVHHARSKGINRIILPADNGKEALLIEGIEVLPIRHLQEVRVLEEQGESVWKIYRQSSVTDSRSGAGYGTVTGGNACTEDSVGMLEELRAVPSEIAGQLDYGDIFGQQHAKQAMMIAAAGFHNLVLIGPPGTGKTMLIRRLPTILPDLSDDEALDATKIYSVAGKMTGRAQLLRTRPFRAPHHTISAAGLVGGGSIPRPGEVSLAHHGVLFLDELPEFSRIALEVLRQPLEDRVVTIGRARAVFSFPAHFMLTCSMNPCPCGFYSGDTAESRCTCSPLKVAQYRSRISGPLLDRIDLHVEVPKVDYDELSGDETPLSSTEMKNRILSAQERQTRRYVGSGIRRNGELAGKLLRLHCRLEPEAEDLLKQAFQGMGLSVRAHDRILKISRTIADLDGADRIGTEHMAQAVTYRCLDRKL
ncbi:YifB family Mg chelatase-like AAA ATPase [Gorillibacterium massiliense]|uniref:YifB family Mg chelatase-like AAA ATPase n=1 Tax=Gorillibacterium massiliense TaxID=1280390 RepID=UPI0004B525D2|nr:YifB family Mg chelatase-like AAA ATPase [Gorillibacterium massiliense]